MDTLALHLERDSGIRRVLGRWTVSFASRSAVLPGQAVEARASECPTAKRNWNRILFKSSTLEALGCVFWLREKTTNGCVKATHSATVHREGGCDKHVVFVYSTKGHFQDLRRHQHPYRSIHVSGGEGHPLRKSPALGAWDIGQLNALRGNRLEEPGLSFSSLHADAGISHGLNSVGLPLFMFYDWQEWSFLYGGLCLASTLSSYQFRNRDVVVDVLHVDFRRAGSNETLEWGSLDPLDTHSMVQTKLYQQSQDGVVFGP